MAKQVYLHGKCPKGSFTLVDDEDYLRVKLAKPYMSEYVYCWVNGKQTPIHHFVLNLDTKSLTAEGKMVDHINGIIFDNRKENLRVVSVKDNNKNKARYKNNTSGHVGVIKVGERWRAKIYFEGKEISLGMYDLKEDAISAYDKKADELFGEYRRKDANLWTR